VDSDRGSGGQLMKLFLILFIALCITILALILVCHKMEEDLKKDDAELMEWMKHERDSKRH
jgi:preprotein translocase subunit SecG